jgi:uncharacterized protein
MLKDLFKYQSFEVAERAVQNAKKESSEYKQLVALKAEFTKEKEKYLSIEQETQTLANQLAAFPSKIEELEEKIANENAAIYDGSVGNVKELAARETQLTTLNEKLKELQNLNALYLEEYEQKTLEQQLSKDKIAVAYEEFTKIKEEYQKLQVGWQKQMDAIAKEKNALKATIAQDELDWFEKVKNKCNGTPVAMLNEEHVCSGCYTIVPPVTFKRTCLGQETYCEKCGRILFVEELEAKE